MPTRPAITSQRELADFVDNTSRLAGGSPGMARGSREVEEIEIAENPTSSTIPI
jgi:hypothetical protein